MDLASGVFTVPVNGTYHFDFSGLTYNDLVYIDLMVNGELVGRSFQSLKNHLSVTLSASLQLKVGDRVNLFKHHPGILYDAGGEQFTHFSGWLVEEFLN